MHHLPFLIGMRTRVTIAMRILKILYFMASYALPMTRIVKPEPKSS
jgi:hypothetical protein